MEIFEYARLMLSEPRNIFYSGQVLSGYIDCKLTEPLTYTVINANFLGEADVIWTESETEEYNGVRRCVNVEYSGHETYFNTMICISGGSGVVTLPPGTHRVPFQFQIPHTAPSSFSGERGSVSYKVVTYIEYPDPSRERDQLEKAFEVVAPLDLNIGDDIKNPIDLEFEEFYSCCCSSSPLNVKIHIPVSGFCPGQAIPISVCADNESNVEVKKMRFDLIQKECYHSIQPKSDYIPPDTVLESIKIGAILSQSKRENTYELIVPDFIAPNLQNCNIIDIGYFMKVTIKLSGCNDDLEDETEICLGLIPLASMASDYRHPMKSDLPEAAIPDPNYSMAPPVQNMQMNGHIQNSSAYPTASPFPNQGGPFPMVSPYPSSQPQQSIPMSNLRTGTIGFVAHSAPYPGANSAPYPGANSAPYPGANSAPYPGANIAPYPGANSTPYPGANSAPYPGANSAPYPGANSAPYPGANSAPYPSANSAPTANSAPFPTHNSVPYPASNSAPYPVNQPGHQDYPPAPYLVHSAPSAPPS